MTSLAYPLSVFVPLCLCCPLHTLPRYPPQPRFQPFSFYSCVRLGDPEMLGAIMSSDPYFITQDNGAGE